MIYCQRRTKGAIAPPRADFLGGSKPPPKKNFLTEIFKHTREALIKFFEWFTIVLVNYYCLLIKNLLDSLPCFDLFL